MNVFITGAAGFLGSHLVKYHIEQGDHVWGIDSFLSGHASNLAAYADHPLFRFDKANILDWDGLSEAVMWADRIYHMAAVIGQKLVLHRPLDVLTENVYGCERLLQAATQNKNSPPILIASSSSVYGYNEEENCPPNKESDVLPTRSLGYVQQTYPLSKIVNEVTALAYAGEKGISCVVVRIFNAIGLNQPSQYGFVVPTFVEQALKGSPITVYGDGLQKRSFCNVRDTIKGLRLLLDTPAANGHVVNVGNDKEISINDLSLLVKQQTGSSSEICHVPYKKAYGIDFKETRSRVPSLETLYQLTKFKPTIPLEETIEEVIKAKRGAT